MGASGAVTKVDRWGHQSRIVEGLASYANTPDNTNAIGPHGITVLGANQVYVTNGGPTEPKDASGSPISRDTLAAQNPAADLFGCCGPSTTGRSGRSPTSGRSSAT